MKKLMVYMKAIRNVTASLCLIMVTTHAISADLVEKNQQEKTVSGRVTSSEDTDGLPGVNVILRGTTTGTVTDIQGMYTLEISGNEPVLVFSSVGFVQEEVAVGNQTSIDIVLSADITALEEIVVVGYGTQKKTTLTGAVVQVKGDDVVREKGTSNGLLALQGEIPGVVVTRNSSRPGNEGASIKIRGDYSINGGEPLVVLDGLIVPVETLSTMNSNDIETISVLKDGAAAIYGTRAAGGVILVTTKQGKQGRVKVNYNGQLQFNFANGNMPVAGLQDWARMWLQAGDNDAVDFIDSDGNPQTATPNYRFFTRPELVSLIDGTMPLAPDTYFFNGKDHYFEYVNQYDEVYGTTTSNRHDINLSGGNEKVTYRTSFGFNDERSPISFVYDGAKRFNFRTNLAYSINEMLKTDFTVSYDNQKIDEPTKGVGEGIQDMYLFPMYNPAGQYYDNFGGNNMLAKLDEGGRMVTTNKIIRLGAKITLDLDKHVEGLSFLYDLNVGNYDFHRRERATTITMYDWEGNVTFLNPTLNTSYVRDRFQESFSQIHNVVGNYRFALGSDHNFGLMGGVTAQEDERARAFQSRSNMASDDLDDIQTGDITTQSTNDNNWKGSSAVGLISYLGRLTYDYKGILLVDGLIRRDGSSRLHPDEQYRWKNFFNFGAGIRLSEMGFMQNGIFDNLKLRASYGETGSVNGIGNYDYFSLMSTGSTIFGASPALANTAWIGGITNIDRTWERIANTNFGLDMAFLENRLSATIEYFDKKNKGMLILQGYPAPLGDDPPTTNSGDFTTTGWEASVNWNDQAGDFKYSVGIQYWDNQSEVTYLAGGSTTIVHGLNNSFDTRPGRAKFIEGKPLNPIYTYVTDGYLTTEEEILEYYNQYGFVSPEDHNVQKDGTLLNSVRYNSGNKLTPGSVRRVDVNGDGIISTDDLVYFGDSAPHHNYAINLGLEWHGFDFRALFQGVGQQYIRREGALAFPYRNWWRNQNVTFLGNTWTPENQNADHPVMHYNGARKNWNYGHTNDVGVIKANYLRAKVLSLGYTLPSQMVQKMGLERVRFNVTGNNVFVISNVKDGLDPEHQTSATQGNSVPYGTSLLFGIDLTF